MKRYRILTLPRTLFMRLALVMLAGVVMAQGFALWLTMDAPTLRDASLFERLPAVLLIQLPLIAGCIWIVVRLATRPLGELTRASQTFGPDLKPYHLSEDGPVEVAEVAQAFNAMQERICACLQQRIQILAAIAHDLQTPITRMRIRADMMGDEIERSKMQDDLRQMESLVREGVVYARVLHCVAEDPLRLDLDAFVESLVADYIDGGGAVWLVGLIGQPVSARPHALRRVLCNLIDNAIKYSGSAEVRVVLIPDQRITISVLDRGPGIPAGKLNDVFRPFYRVESSSSRNATGSGLGLAIAKQLAESMNGSLKLVNRDGGGIEARLTLNGAA